MNPPSKVDAKASHPHLAVGQGSGQLELTEDEVIYWSTANESKPIESDVEDGEPDIAPAESGNDSDDEPSKALVRFPLEGLKIKLGGASNRLVMLTHPESPDWQFMSSNKKWLQHPSWTDHPDVQLINRQLSLKTKIRGFALLTTVALCLLLCMGLWKGVDPASRWIAVQIPPETEAQLGGTVFEQIAAEKNIIDDPLIVEQLDRLAEPLILAIDSDRYEFHFTIIEDESINAFALPGGYMAIHTGLILKADRPEEVLGVMAHELAHVTEQHSMRILIKQIGLRAFLSFFLGDLASVTDILVANAPSLLHLKFSRDHETEADAVGFEYLERANIDPSGMVGFFQKIKEEHEESGMSMEGALSILSTHPATDDRIAHLSDLIENESHGGPYKNLNLNFEEFQRMLQAELDHTE